MTTDRRRPHAEQMLCGSLHADDGVDPRSFSKPERQNKPNRKDLQLCSQALRALNLAFAAEVHDPLLRDIMIESAHPAPDASRLAIIVRVPANTEPARLAAIEASLQRRRGFLRSEVAAAISRKRAPELTFQVIPMEAHS